MSSNTARYYFLMIAALATLSISSANAAESRMQRHQVKEAVSRQAQCLDGTPAIYYLQPGSGEGQSTWVISLGGGGQCHSEQDCKEWAEKGSGRASSRRYGKYLQGQGILSADRKQNPYFYNTNRVFITLCSADVWIGDGQTEKLHFRGNKIIRSVVEDVFARQPASKKMQRVLLNGNSAGCFGEASNLDWLADHLKDRATVKGLCDGGWFLPQEPYLPGTTVELSREQRNSQVRAMHKVILNSDCIKKMAKEDDWKCAYPSELYPYLHTPQFIRVGQYDKKLLELAGVTKPYKDKKKIEFAKQRAKRIRASLSGVDNVYSSNSHFHTVTINNRFAKLEADGVSFMQALANWFYHDQSSRLVDVKGPNLRRP